MEGSSGDEDEENWKVPLERSEDKNTPYKSPFVRRDSNTGRITESMPLLNPNTSAAALIGSEHTHERTIMQIDIDCFYAQVEMIRNPTLRDKPLGIQQKYIVVTCNYKARDFGVTKLMTLKDAKEKCPQLILVSGEDLTNYRSMSYKITEVLQKLSPVVERLGFDENFIDISPLVESRLSLMGGAELKSVKVEGFIYGLKDNDLPDVTQNDGNSCGCGCHLRLAIGSQIASEIRQTLYSELGITCCAGIAHNKLLAKLVGSMNKPNKQTTLLPGDAVTFMRHLGTVNKIPGIGYSTAKKLSGLGVNTISDLQTCTIETLLPEFDESPSRRMKQLSYGVDDTVVKLTGQPQSISDEDSFRKCSTEKEAKEKMLELLDNLLTRLHEDGRTPQTIRLTVRKFSTVNKYGNRESRQCAIPAFVLSNFTPDSFPRVKVKLCEILLQLFYKLVDVNTSFHLTLINVGFAKFADKSKNKIRSFFEAVKDVDQTTGDLKNETSKCENSLTACSTNATPVKKLSENLSEDLQESLGFVNSRKRLFSPCASDDNSSTKKSRTKAVGDSNLNFGYLKNYPVFEQIPAKADFEFSPDSEQITRVKTNLSEIEVPSGMDKSIFRSLPVEIQRELMEFGEHKTCYSEQKDKDTNKEKKFDKKNKICVHGNSGQQTLDSLCHKVSVKHTLDRALNNSNATMGSSETLMNSSSVKELKSTNTDLSSRTLSKKDIFSVGNKNSPQLGANVSPGENYSTKSASQTIPPNLTVPPNIDKNVFNSLPRELQEELFLDWRLKNGMGSSKKQRTSGILKYYQKKS